MSGINTICKYKTLTVVCIAVLVCLALLIANIQKDKENPSDVGKIEKEGDISLLSSNLISSQTLTVGVSGVAGTPYLAATDGDEMACGLIYEPLLTFDANGKIEFIIADKLDVNEDGNIYTIHIDKNRKFSNGSLVTPEDIKLSYQLISDSSVDSKYSAALSYIKGYNEFRNGATDEIKGITTGDGFISFQFVKSTWNNIDALSVPITNASGLDYLRGSAKSIIVDKNYDLLGTGAYVLNSVNTDGIELINTNAQEDEFSKVSIIPIGISSVTSLFKAGLLDMYVFEYEPKLLKEINEIPQASLYSYASSSVPYIGLNCREGTLSDIRVRKGLALAIQKQKSKAKKQLSKAGYGHYTKENQKENAKILNFTIITYNVKSFISDCEYIAGLLEESGIRCQIEPLALGELRERVKNGNYDLYYTKSEVGKHSSVYFTNNEIEGMADKEIEELLVEMEAETDYVKYQKIYLDLIKAYENKVTRIVPDNIKRYILYSPRFKNISPNPYTNAFWKLEQYKINK